jgi:hypothetical protein
LTIDQAKYFNFQVDDVDAAQSNVNLLDGGITEAAYGLADVVDKYIAGFYTEVLAGNTIGNDTTPAAPTKDTAYDSLVDLGVILDENDVPETGRFVVVPAWYYGLLLKDARFTKDSTIIRTGYVGDIDGMTVYKSNNVQKQFSDAMKGLQVFGAKSIKPEALAVLTANKS